MAPTSTRRVVAYLDVASSPCDGSPAIRCPKCLVSLELHQHDPDDPGRLLGTCDSCGDWHFIRIEPGAGTTVVSFPPDLLALLPGDTDSEIEGDAKWSSSIGPSCVVTF